jgi:CheY-like chemotaxis protein
VASILCIDDDPKVLNAYKALLAAKGYTVLTAPDGPTGLAITRKYSISLVVLDFRMPGMDGNQVARVLMQEHPKLPVVICSGFADEIPESLKWFADVVLEKGDDPDTLLSAIDKLIGSETKKASA